MGSQKISITYNQQPNAAPYRPAVRGNNNTDPPTVERPHNIPHGKIDSLSFCCFFIFSRVRETWREIMAYSQCIQRVYVCIYTHKPLHPHTIYMYILYVVGRLPQCICIFFTFGDFLRLNFQYVMGGVHF